ncbi:c6 transcription factor [Fusarium sporotrichioides]|uniref:C6 transcription factor n=1 Tax=Fusarium sporotrichioides TaxID=5514 RepID=A0A395SLF2_FUSSP|nr:c6 transcription factor [Fusarium sporotrichioides]
MANSPQDDISVRAKLDSGQKRNRPERSNAKVRASIACIPCRKEGKLCYYVGSRRGIRDPKKRNMIRDEVPMTDQDDTTESTPSPNLSSSDNPFLSQDRYLSLYYANFHVAHSWVLPRRMLEPLLQANPNDMRFLEVTIAYIASRYSKVDSSSLWDRVYEMSRERLLPTLWNVQALLSLSIALFGEQNGFHRNLFWWACQLALNGGGLQPEACADQQKRLFMAESCRRTYWGLYVHEMLLGMREDPMHSSLCPTKSTAGTELPCEEWQYETGASIAATGDNSMLTHK